MFQALSRLIVHTFFREVIVEGREHLPEKGPVIFTPNHPNGLLDPLLMFFLSPSLRLRFVAKAPLFKIPGFGSILKSMGAIPVVRRMEADGDVDYSAFFAACVDALAEGDSIVIFPEGRSLPQAYMAPLRTGPARLFLLAQRKDIEPRIIPIGLNYERGTTFRSAVLVVIAPAIETGRYRVQNDAQSNAAAKELTAEIAESLQRHVVQAENYRDRELMLLLERLSSDQREKSWLDRFLRLKEFENGLKRLHPVCSQEIDRLRKLLGRYKRLSSEFGMEGSSNPRRAQHSWWSLFALAVGSVIALIGWSINYVPYQITDLLIRWTRKDESDAATFKVIFSLFVFPSIYVLEIVIVGHLLGRSAAMILAVLMIPLSYFTLFFSEWRERVTLGNFWIGRKDRIERQLERLRQRISKELQSLASRPELR